MWTHFFFSNTDYFCALLSPELLKMIFCPIMCMYISCVGLCVHVFMNPLPSWFVCVFSQMFYILCYASGFYMLLFVVRCLWCAHVRARVIHWHCSAQLSMSNMEKCYRNKIIIIIIITSIRVAHVIGKPSVILKKIVQEWNGCSRKMKRCYSTGISYQLFGYSPLVTKKGKRMTFWDGSLPSLRRYPVTCSCAVAASSTLS